MNDSNDPLKVVGDLIKSAENPLAPEALAQSNAVSMGKFVPPGDWHAFAKQTGRIACPACHALNARDARRCQTCDAPFPSSPTNDHTA